MANNKNCLLVEKVVEHAKIPTKATCESAGYDLYSCVDTTIPPGGRAAISTGLRMKPPRKCYIRLAGRSGLAFNNGVIVGAGVCDRDYVGVVMVLLINLGVEDVTIKIGDRIAQAVVEKYKPCSIVEVKAMETTVRGESGFGASGV